MIQGGFLKLETALHLRPLLFNSIDFQHLIIYRISSCWNIEKHWNNANTATSEKRAREKQHIGWLPSPSDLSDNVQHLPPFPLHGHFF
jgi:hypothetical protein